jgi:hypothetical protein
MHEKFAVQKEKGAVLWHFSGVNKLSLVLAFGFQLFLKLFKYLKAPLEK